MYRIFCVLFLLLNLSVYSQSDIESVIPNELGEYFEVINHPKSLSNFKIKTPYGFYKYREGRDNSVIQIFRKIDNHQRIDVSGRRVNNGVIEFGVTALKWKDNSLKWKDNSKYEAMPSMSNAEIKELIIGNIESRDKTIDPNQVTVLYEKNELFWIITGSWSEEKNLYIIVANYYTNEQALQLSFMTTIKGNIEKDIINMKNLIDSFQLI